VRGLVTRAGMPAMTPRSITDVDALLDELALVRAAGHAVDDGEQETGVRCVAVAVPNRPATAISVSGPAGRVTPDAVTEMLPSLLAAADRLAGRR
jgi:IclR family acetate operon transcriptional repressor